MIGCTRDSECQGRCCRQSSPYCAVSETPPCPPPRTAPDIGRAVNPTAQLLSVQSKPRSPLHHHPADESPSFLRCGECRANTANQKDSAALTAASLCPLR